MYNPDNLKNLLNKYKFGKYLFVGGFTFFFVKGIIWLGIFIALYLGSMLYPSPPMFACICKLQRVYKDYTWLDEVE